ncbi:hypothetical protein C6I20_09900 [Aeromicrobium sp. A1-2]|nr:hypothetical protein C6I20_09900 [Aeromicrobium sp. A1-2]
MVALPVVLTLVIAGVIGALVVVQNQRQTEQVARADLIAQDYLAAVASFRAAVVKQVSAAKETDPGALRKIVERGIAEPPKLADAPKYGREHSTVYAEAEQTQATVLEPFTSLSKTLKRADTGVDFIASARTVLALRATDYISTDVSSSELVRSSLIPAFTRARDEFAQVKVPSGQQELADKVSGAVQYVIDQAAVLAQRIDSRQSFSFSYQDQFQAAADAVSDYATQLKGDVAEALNAVGEA